jgi:AcrR family transcriptional regulator
MSQTEAARMDREARREAILDVAQEVFLKEGFAAASMSEIAARLGGSKGTLYNYFRSKDELFEAFVQRRCFWQGEAMFGPLSADGDMAAELIRLGQAYLTHVLSDANLRMMRLIVAEAERWPEIGRIFYEAGPRRGAERLASAIRAWAADGRLAIADPHAAALTFMGLCKDGWFTMRLCNAAPELTPTQIEAQAKTAVGIFLRAFGTERA